jgi:hypothetical protein
MKKLMAIAFWYFLVFSNGNYALPLQTPVVVGPFAAESVCNATAANLTGADDRYAVTPCWKGN